MLFRVSSVRKIFVKCVLFHALLRTHPSQCYFGGIESVMTLLCKSASSSRIAVAGLPRAC
jgi:hypothetical protein